MKWLLEGGDSFFPQDRASKSYSLLTYDGSMGTRVLPSILSVPHFYHGRVVYGCVVTAWLSQRQALEPGFSMFKD